MTTFADANQFDLHNDTKLPQSMPIFDGVGAPGGGAGWALQCGSDGYVPTEEQNRGIKCKNSQKKGVIGFAMKKKCNFWCELTKIGAINLIKLA